MATNLEIEAKALIKEEDYLKLISYFNKPTYKQINYYVDDENFSISKSDSFLRIRFKNNQYELTLKVRQDDGFLEINENINKDDFDDFLKGNLSKNNEIINLIKNNIPSVKELKIFTSLETERTDVIYEKGLLSIDKNKYSNIIDYEVEFEYPNKANALSILKDLFSKLDIEFIENKKGKFTRAKEALYK